MQLARLLTSGRSCTRSKCNQLATPGSTGTSVCVPEATCHIPKTYRKRNIGVVSCNYQKEVPTAQHIVACGESAAAASKAMAEAEEHANGVKTPVKVTAEQLGIVQGNDYSGQLEFDLGNLTAHDPSPIDPQDYTPLNRDTTCLEVATAMTQALVSQLFSLPSEAVQGGRLAHLPAPTTVLPREKPIPKAKPLTKWQKFAQEKGIRKRKRSKLTYDDEAGEWRRRHGYKRANDDSEVPVIEARATDVPGEDPFTQLRQEKRERLKKQNKQQLANVKQAVKVSGAAAVPATLRLAAALPEKGKGKPAKRRELRDEIKTMSWLSGVSTASMGKFDKRLKGEKEDERKLPGKRRKFLPVTDTAAERAVFTKAADKLLREKSADVLDINKAIGRFEAEARQQRHAANRAAGSDDEGGGGNRSKGKRKGGKGGKGQEGAKAKNRGRLSAKGGVSKKGAKGGKAGKGGKGKR